MEKEYFLSSDFHFEMDSGKKIKKVVDNILPDTYGIIIAGDIGVMKDLPMAKNHIKFRLALDLLTDKYDHVVYVPGNHDYLFACREEVDKAFTRYNEEYENLDILNNSSIQVNGTTIAGATMWPFESRGTIISRNLFTDYRNIRDKREKQEDWWRESRDYFEKLDNGNKDTILVYHYVPEQIYDYFYQKHLFSLVLMRIFGYDDFFKTPCYSEYAKTVIFGHIHLSFNKNIGGTQFICNPLGYDFKKWEWFVKRSNFLNEENFIRIG